MISQPLVTVAVLCYNSATYSSQALNSVTNSRYKNMEIICIDDGSLDDEALQFEKAARAANARFYRNKKNKGIPAVCNIALRLAKGDFLILIGDDIILENRIAEDVKTLLDNPDCGFVCSSVETIDERGRSIQRVKKPHNKTKARKFSENPESVWLNGPKAFSPSVTYRVASLLRLGGWDESFPGPDLPLFTRLAQQKIPGVWRSEITTLYRIHSSNYSKQFRVGEIEAQIRMCREYQLQIPPWKVSLKVFKYLHYWLLYQNLNTEMAIQALEKAQKSELSYLVKSRTIRLAVALVAHFFRKGGSKPNLKKYLLEI